MKIHAYFDRTAKYILYHVQSEVSYWTSDSDKVTDTVDISPMPRTPIYGDANKDSGCVTFTLYATCELEEFMRVNI